MSNELEFPIAQTREEFDEQTRQEIENKKPKKLKGLTRGQEDYLDTINESVVTMCSGCAGTGKTYIAIVRAVELLQEGLFSRILVARPIIECGNSLGFLPGKVEEKIEPYMKPIKDILREVIEPKVLEEYLKNETIEFAALAYMRGRTLNNTVMILDEAQNAKWEELIMFLTRIGANSKVIVSGDESQEDVFGRAFEQLSDKFATPPYVDGINIVSLGPKDIVRNGLIQKIIKKAGSYDKDYFSKDANNNR